MTKETIITGLTLVTIDLDNYENWDLTDETNWRAMHIAIEQAIKYIEQN